MSVKLRIRLANLLGMLWLVLAGTAWSASPTLYFVHTDHLDTPRTITNGAQQTVWRWDNDDAFGNNAPNENPSALGNFACNLRLPGQYFDKETNLHYNYFRDYDPSIGRYVQSDPIGLNGGINTYGYVGGNPLSLIDPFGLWAWGDPVDQRIVDWSAGFGDALSFSGTRLIRKFRGTDDAVNMCSDFYDAGDKVALAAGLGRLAYMGAVKSIPLLLRGVSDPRTAAGMAVDMRNALVAAFRGPLTVFFPPWVTLGVRMEQTGGDFARIVARAGISNRPINAFGGYVAASSLTNTLMIRCECHGK